MPRRARHTALALCYVTIAAALRPSLKTRPRTRLQAVASKDVEPLLLCKDIEAKVVENDKAILKGLGLGGAAPARSTPSWARTAPANRLCRKCCKASCLRSHKWNSDFRRRGLARIGGPGRGPEGRFLAFQYPVELPGVGNTDF